MAIQISGTTVIDNTRKIVNVATGSSTAPSITPTSDTNTGIYFPSADTLSFSTGGVLRLNIDTNVTTDGQFRELYNGTYWNVVTQADVGYGASQVPLNQYLGQLAFLDDFSPNALREEGAGSDSVIVGAGGTLGVLNDFYSNANTYIPTVASDITMSNGNIIFPAVEGRGVYFGGETSGTSYGYIREASNGQLHFGSDDAVRFFETDANTERVNWSLNTGTFTFNGTVIGGTRLLAGTSSVTGTASQNLQVSGGAYVSGDVGIGQTNPGAKLDVSGDIRLSAADPEIEFNTGGPRLKVPAANTLTIHTGGGLNSTSSEVIRINTTGVGINTTNPTAKLDVNGDVAISSNVSIGTTIDIVPYDNLGTLSFEGSAGQLFSITNNLTTGSIFSVNDVSGIPSIDVDADGTVLIAPYGSTEYVGIGTTNPSQKFEVVGNSRITGNSYVTGNFGVGTLTPTEKIDVVGNAKVTGNSYVSGNFGVGTVSPVSHLDVYKANSDIFSRNSSTSGTASLIAADGDFFSTPSYAGVLVQKKGTAATGNIFSSIPNANLGVLAFQNTANGLIYTNGATPLILGTTSLERLRITSSGDVGIGIANPSAKLHVSGSLIVTGEAQLNRVAITTTATNITMQAGRTYPYYSSITLTLPASPTAGDKVEIINRSNTSTAVIARNGRNIMGLAENMTIDLPDVGFTLIYANLADGWIIGK